MITLQGIPWWLLTLLLLLGVLLYALFWGIRTYVLPLVKSTSRLQRWQGLLLRIELAVWLGYGLFSLYRLLLQAPLVTVILLGVLLLLGRLWWRDWLPGLLFRLDQDVEAGDFLVYQSQRYRIQAIRPRNLRLLSKQGELLVLPYRLLDETRIVKATASTFMTHFSFELSYDVPDAAARLERFMADCPWVVPAHPPKIESLGEGRFRIHSFAPDEGIEERQRGYVLGRL
jgi:hypothetical protein